MSETVGELIERFGKRKADLLILANSIKARSALAEILRISTDPDVRAIAEDGLHSTENTPEMDE